MKLGVRVNLKIEKGWGMVEKVKRGKAWLKVGM